MKELKKKSLVGVVALSLLTGGGLTYAGTQLSWGGEDNLAKIESSVNTLLSQVSKRDEKIKNVKAEKEELETSKTTLAKELDEKNQKLIQLQKELDEVTSALDRTEELFQQHENESEATISDLNSKINTLGLDKEELNIQIANEKAKYDDAYNKYLAAVEDIKSYENELGKAKDDVETLRIKIDKQVQEVTMDDSETEK